MQLPCDRPAEVECHARVIDQGDAEMAAHEMEVRRHALFQTESGQWRRTHFGLERQRRSRQETSFCVPGGRHDWYFSTICVNIAEK
jgi:hypothetical protein